MVSASGHLIPIWNFNSTQCSLEVSVCFWILPPCPFSELLSDSTVTASSPWISRRVLWWFCVWFFFCMSFYPVWVFLTSSSASTLCWCFPVPSWMILMLPKSWLVVCQATQTLLSSQSQSLLLLSLLKEWKWHQKPSSRSTGFSFCE